MRALLSPACQVHYAIEIAFRGSVLSGYACHLVGLWLSLVAFSLVIVLWSNTLNPPRSDGTFGSLEAAVIFVVLWKQNNFSWVIRFHMSDWVLFVFSLLVQGMTDPVPNVYHVLYQFVA